MFHQNKKFEFYLLLFNTADPWFKYLKNKISKFCFWDTCIWTNGQLWSKAADRTPTFRSLETPDVSGIFYNCLMLFVFLPHSSCLRSGIHWYSTRPARAWSWCQLEDYRGIHISSSCCCTGIQYTSFVASSKKVFTYGYMIIFLHEFSFNQL